MLCRLLMNFLKPRGQAAGWAATTVFAVLSGPVIALSGASSALAQGTEGLQARLFSQVRQSVAQSQKVPLNTVELAPLDPRVQLQDCNQPLAVDLPFASRETVRVRCLAQPGWQLYLRLQMGPPRAAATATGAPIGVPTDNAGNANPGATEAAGPAMRSAVVARQLIQRGAQLEPGMFEEVSLPAQGMDPQAVSSLRDLQYGELVRDVAAGQVMRSHDIRRAVLVKQGQQTLMTVGKPGDFQITLRVEAMQDGRMGEQIRLKNPDSGRLISGTVIGPAAVRGL